MRVLSILGGRPHVIKAESIHEAFSDRGAEHVLLLARISTFADYPGQCSADFDLPEPVACINAASEQSLSQRLLEPLHSLAPDVVLLYGDLMATQAAFVAAAAFGCPLVHIESGYRSGDLLDDEEHTRITVDHGATHRIAHSDAMVGTLRGEGVALNSISVFGNPALLTLQRHLSQDQVRRHVRRHGLATMHRAENLEDEARRRHILKEIVEVADLNPLVFILYRRTEEILSAFDELEPLKRAKNLTVVPTQTYAEYLRLLNASQFVITDSSGLQDDSSYLGIPCFIVRRATPRPIASTARLIGGPDGLDWKLADAVLPALSQVGRSVSPPRPELRPYDDSFLMLLDSLVSCGNELD